MGALFDRTNIKVTMFADAAAGLMGIALIFAAFATGANVLFIVGALFAGFAYGGMPVIASSFARARFGAKNYPLNFSVASFAICFGALLNMGIAACAAGSRLAVFACMLGLGVVAFLDVFVFARMWKRQVEDVLAAS